MDGNHFDALTRALARTGSRRVVLRRAAGAAALIAAGRPIAGGATCPVGQYAGSGHRCLCKATGRPPVGGACGCDAGQAACPSGCADLASDVANCGACGNTCAPDESCQAGGCIAVCRAINAACASDAQCCSGYCPMGSGGGAPPDVRACCLPGQVWFFPGGDCCFPAGMGPCETNTDCCEGTCVQGGWCA